MIFNLLTNEAEGGGDLLTFRDRQPSNSLVDRHSNESYAAILADPVLIVISRNHRATPVALSTAPL